MVFCYNFVVVQEKCGKYFVEIKCEYNSVFSSSEKYAPIFIITPRHSNFSFLLFDTTKKFPNFCNIFTTKYILSD